MWKSKGLVRSLAFLLLGLAAGVPALAPYQEILAVLGGVLGAAGTVNSESQK